MFSRRNSPAFMYLIAVLSTLKLSRGRLKFPAGEEILFPRPGPEVYEHALDSQPIQAASGATVRPGTRATNDSLFERRRIERAWANFSCTRDRRMFVRRRMNSAVMINAPI